jgi:hypothetical protein
MVVQSVAKSTDTVASLLKCCMHFFCLKVVYNVYLLCTHGLVDHSFIYFSTVLVRWYSTYCISGYSWYSNCAEFPKNARTRKGCMIRNLHNL